VIFRWTAMHSDHDSGYNICITISARPCEKQRDVLNTIRSAEVAIILQELSSTYCSHKFGVRMFRESDTQAR
jgi:hypothetical protein